MPKVNGKKFPYTAKGKAAAKKAAAKKTSKMAKAKAAKRKKTMPKKSIYIFPIKPRKHNIEKWLNSYQTFSLIFKEFCKYIIAYLRIKILNT